MRVDAKTAKGPPRFGRGELPVTTGRLWERCVFVDWHGVLCDDLFWHSITSNPRHQQRARLQGAVRDLFAGQPDLVTAWMRGQVDTQHVVATLPPTADRRCGPDFLHRRLVEDCRRVRPRLELLAALSALPELTLVVIATDNMDCFAASLPALRPLHGVVHAVLCSSDLGVLKSDDPALFFGAWLDEHGLAPEQSVLVDDADRNCAGFERFGGAAVRFREIGRAVRDLRRWVRRV